MISFHQCAVLRIPERCLFHILCELSVVYADDALLVQVEAVQGAVMPPDKQSYPGWTTARFERN